MLERKQSSTLVCWATLLLGAMDTASGFLMFVAPAFTIRLMGISESYQDVLIRFIGAFVFGVGSLYLLALGWSKLTRSWQALRIVWMGTGWIRLCVGLGTSVFIMQGQLSIAWITVPLADLLTAAFQIATVLSGKFPKDD